MILVTGGTGLVGAHLLFKLVSEKHEVRALYRSEKSKLKTARVFSYYSDNVDHLMNSIDWVKGDLEDLCSLEKLFADVHTVYHSAALISFDSRDYHRMRRINIDGTSNIVNLSIANKVSDLIFVSSVAALDKTSGKSLIDESCEWSSENRNYGYAITKYGAEMEVWRASQEGINIFIVNPGIIIGPGFWDEGPGSMFTTVFKGLRFYSKGVTGYISVHDVVNALLNLKEKSTPNERYVLVSENLAFKDVFSSIAKSLNRKPPSIYVSPMASELVWRIEKMLQFLFGRKPIITKQTSKAMHNNYLFSSKKYLELGASFESIEEIIEFTSGCFLRDHEV